ncbi:ECM29 [Lepeophtheirus salmonis]|uniref:ECM29 n=1 Tax=Lepeophtheirus salmonis TaxID=72036 RepID=A0A7R8H9I0_LEPSM|nr:ECM29 [Lepeophtheirus salmonis]CAF2955373.1 ECM29 [Lepeophtheirus salmonis]
MCDDELILVERVFLRFVSCDDDTHNSLQSNVTKTPGSLSLNPRSPKEGVRKKVLELFVHLNKRIKNNTKIKLPMGTLIELYANPKHSGFTEGFHRGPSPPVHGREAFESTGLFLLFMILPYLGEIKPDSFQLTNKPQIKSALIKYISDYLLLPYGVYPDANSPPPPCLNFNAWKKRVSGDPPYPASEVITSNKAGICVFLGSGVLKPTESAMRQIRGSLDWNSSVLIEKIRDLFIGNRSASKDGNMPADVRLRLKFMPYLIKSREATIRSDIAMPILTELLNESNEKLKTLKL